MPVIPATKEEESRRIKRTLSENQTPRKSKKPGAGSLASWEAEVERIAVRGWLGK
jgi:hypothetical protein